MKITGPELELRRNKAAAAVALTHFDNFGNGATAPGPTAHGDFSAPFPSLSISPTDFLTRMCFASQARGSVDLPLFGPRRQYFPLEARLRWPDEDRYSSSVCRLIGQLFLSLSLSLSLSPSWH
jgi:hypothetical protein